MDTRTMMRHSTIRLVRRIWFLFQLLNLVTVFVSSIKVFQQRQQQQQQQKYSRQYQQPRKQQQQQQQHYLAFTIKSMVAATKRTRTCNEERIFLHQHQHLQYNILYAKRTTQKKQHLEIDADNDDDDDDDYETVLTDSEVITDNSDSSNDENNESDDDWIPDQIKAQEKRRMTQRTIPYERISTEPTSKTSSTAKSPYTDEEEELIEAMGGKQQLQQQQQQQQTQYNTKQSKRQEGYLGDCTIEEISYDYSIPICYLADVLCNWNVPIPINIKIPIGNIITGEQVFAIAEAINTLDNYILYDRYSNTNLQQLCYENNIQIKDAFQFCIVEQYNLPFGILSCLRIEQENELLRVLGSTNNNNIDFDNDDYDDDDY